jgi:uncharacterized membrane protein YqjE
MAVEIHVYLLHQFVILYVTCFFQIMNLHGFIVIFYDTYRLNTPQVTLAVRLAVVEIHTCSICQKES